MPELEVLLDEVRQTLDRVQTEALEWKGRALGVTPAMKVALAALERIDWVRLNNVWECAWCGGDEPEHKPDCERQVAIKVLKDAIG